MKYGYIFVVGMCVMSLGFAPTTYAHHAWNDFHWSRTMNTFTLKLGDNLSSSWDPVLARVSTDWSASTVLDTVIVPGGTNNPRAKNSPKNCLPTSGRAEICNAKYGTTGWLGLATVWTAGTHITAGTVKMNDTYYSTPSFNTAPWKNLVLCQEVGHLFGLDHQDEIFDNANLGTCMDYTNDASSNQQPNAHDYDMLTTIYSHLDTMNTVSQPTPVALGNAVSPDSDDRKGWGREIRRSKNGHASLFMKDLGKGNKVFHHVYWIESQNETPSPESH